MQKPRLNSSRRCVLLTVILTKRAHGDLLIHKNIEDLCFVERNKNVQIGQPQNIKINYRFHQPTPALPR
jgi:hypothetical protein